MTAVWTFLAERRKAIAALLAPWALAGLVALGHAIGVDMPVDLPTVTTAIASIISAIVVHETANEPPPPPAPAPPPPPH